MKKLCAFLLMALLMVPVWAGADDIILPDPGYYFGREYNGSYIEFDEYPYAEYNAYVSLLVNQYGMQIMSAYSGESDEFYFLQMPGTEYTRTFIWCYQYSDGCGIEAYFDNGISLEPLDVYGQRPDAEEPAEEKSAAKGQIAWDDGLSVMSPEQYLGIKPCDHIYQQDNYYGYRYINRGFKKYGDKSKNCEEWYAMEDYLNALIESGYYEVIEHTISSTKDKEYWCLGYTGSKAIHLFGADRKSTQSAAIVIISAYGDFYVRYSVDILTDDLDETQKRLGTDIFVKSNNNGPSILPTCDACNGSGDCTYCWGRGTDGITGRDCAVCDRGNCSYCHGSGHK